MVLAVEKMDVTLLECADFGCLKSDRTRFDSIPLVLKRENKISDSVQFMIYLVRMLLDSLLD